MIILIVYKTSRNFELEQQKKFNILVSFTYLIILVITYATNQISEIFIKHTFEIAFNFFQSHCDDECSQKKIIGDENSNNNVQNHDRPTDQIVNTIYLEN